MSQTSVSGEKGKTTATQPQNAVKMTLGAYAKITAADAVFLEEGEQLNLQPSISIEQKGQEVIVTAEFKDVNGKAEKVRKRISVAMLNELARMIEEGKTGWHRAYKEQGEKGQYFAFSKEGAA